VDSSGGRLDELQKRILAALADVEPPFTLSGGGALAGVYLGHRVTRDLDLFWREQTELGDLPRTVEMRLREDGLRVSPVQRTPAFVRLHATDGERTAIVDLIAEASASVEPPRRHRIGDAEILVDTSRAILVEKLCALLERSEPRDLVDVEALVRNGEDLDTAIRDAPLRDSGFSPLTLAWVLRELDVTAGNSAADAARLDAFRERLIERLVTP
jgi:hypothetical protein